MIIFLAPPPDSHHRDGYIQRVRDVDNIFHGVTRLYVEKTRKWESVGLRPCGANSYACVLPDECSEIEFWNIIKPFADQIYIHSIYQFEIFKKFIELAKKENQVEIILDVHGVVPQEILLSSGQQSDFQKWNEIEKAAFFCADKLIYVTKSMQDFFKDKYKIVDKRTFVLSINRPTVEQMNHSELNLKLKAYKEKPNSVYAGGTQKWQKVDEVIKAMILTSTNALILSPDKAYFRGKLGNKIKLGSTDSKGVIAFLKLAHFSFILRDDNLINSVACPTKLVEAMTFGCLPIIDSEMLGDFNELGFKYIRRTDFVKNCLPTPTEFELSIKENFKIIDFLESTYEATSKQIFDQVSNCEVPDSVSNSIHSFIKSERVRVIKKILRSKRILRPKELYKIIRYVVSRK